MGKVRKEVKAAYEGILDTRFYAGLMKTYCENNPTLCDQRPLREKRFLPVLAAIGGLLGLTGLGMGLHQSWQIDGIQNKIKALDHAIENSRQLIFHQSKVIIRHSKANQHTYSFLHHALKDVTAMVEQVRCGNSE